MSHRGQRGGGGGRRRGDEGGGRGRGDAPNANTRPDGQQQPQRGGGQQHQRGAYQQQQQRGAQQQQQQQRGSYHQQRRGGQQQDFKPAAAPAQSAWGQQRPAQASPVQASPTQASPTQAPPTSVWGQRPPPGLFQPQQPPQQPPPVSYQAVQPPVKPAWNIPAPVQAQPVPTQQEVVVPHSDVGQLLEGTKTIEITEAPSETSSVSSGGSKRKGQKKKKGKNIQPAQKAAVPSTSTTSSVEGSELVSSQPVEIPSSGGGDTIKTQLKKSQGGARGRKVQVFANHYGLNLGKLPIVCQYDVAIDPDKPKKQMRLVMEAFKRRHYRDMNPAYDGSKLLYSVRPLPFGNDIEDTIQVLHDDRMKDYKVKLQKVQEIDMVLIKDFYEKVKHNVLTDVPQIALQVIDVVLRHTQALRHICVGSSLFNIPTPDLTVNLGNGMHMYRGMYQSAILGWRPFLNVDVSNKAFPSATNVIDLIKQFNDRADLRYSLEGWMIDKLGKHLRTLKVEYEIPKNPASKRIYRVNGVASNAREYTFQRDDGSVVNVADYYRTDKGYNIHYPMMPLLWVGSQKSKIYIPAELCTVLPGQAVNRRCDADQTRAMIRECAKNTDYRKGVIETNVRKAKYNQDPVVREFGFSVSDDLEKVEARILPPPSIKYKSGIEKVFKGVWNPREFHISGQLKAGWTVLNLDKYVKPQDINRLVELARNNGRQLNLNMDGYKTCKNLELPRGKEDRALNDFFTDVKKCNLDLVFVILPNRDLIYNYVKKSSEIAIGCLTQCVKSFTLQRKMNDMTMKNILLKVNAKLNGSNHIFANIPEVMKQSYVMVMGADVTHPSPDIVDGFSVAAVTASHDPNAFKYNICWRLQKPGKEIIEDMENITREQLRYFYEVNKGMKPTKIVFYRDGVSTGQFDEVLVSELHAIRRACRSLSADYEPRVTFVVVQKRHHTRFFPVDSRISEDRNNNVPAGTIVDKTIIHPTRQDFYLVSHASIQGVAKPTKYVTLWDDNSLSDDDLEELTYHLCHMFARCTRSVSYPAPTYYAHLAAARGKVYCDTVRRIDCNNLEREQNLLKIKDNIVKGMPMFFV